MRWLGSKCALIIAAAGSHVAVESTTALPPTMPLIETIDAFAVDLMLDLDRDLEVDLDLGIDPLGGIFDLDALETDERPVRTGRVAVELLDAGPDGGLTFWGDLAEDGHHDVIGLDLRYRGESDGGTPLEAHAWIKGSEAGAGAAADHAAFGGRVSQRDDRMPWEIGFAHYGESFVAAPHRGVREYTGRWRYRLRPESLPLRRIEFGVSGQMRTDASNDLQAADARIDVLELETRRGEILSLRYLPHIEALDAPRSVTGGVQVAAGDYRFDRYGAGIRAGRGPITLGFDYTGGEYYAGQREDWQFNLGWKLSQWVTLRFDFTESDLELPGGDATTRTARTNFDIRLAPTVSWRSAVGYDRATGSVGLNSRIRWAITPGNEIVIAVDHGYGTLDGSGWLEPQLTTVLRWGVRF